MKARWTCADGAPTTSTGKVDGGERSRLAGGLGVCQGPRATWAPAPSVGRGHVGRRTASTPASPAGERERLRLGGDHRQSQAAGRETRVFRAARQTGDQARDSSAGAQVETGGSVRVDTRTRSRRVIDPGMDTILYGEGVREFVAKNGEKLADQPGGQAHAKYARGAPARPRCSPSRAKQGDAYVVDSTTRRGGGVQRLIDLDRGVGGSGGGPPATGRWSTTASTPLPTRSPHPRRGCGDAVRLLTPG